MVDADSTENSQNLSYSLVTRAGQTLPPTFVGGFVSLRVLKEDKATITGDTESRRLTSTITYVTGRSNKNTDLTTLTMLNSIGSMSSTM